MDKGKANVLPVLSCRNNARDVDALELEIRVAVVGARRVNAVLVADHLPKFGAALVGALATLA